ncbi:DNA-3-methyladenine glycosylase I [Rhodoligotrophos appendicifer]|uniref:DNA-3-methyladenine glycosylase I n=1 Tax=Rhodoligotrophos appendicifer TaxID=987056 RepID=UPI001185335E|nr:DNA-3-methyladenine glycosylase I [Rhodoligotrophos appendicifer]
MTLISPTNNLAAGQERCTWPGQDLQYITYHDEEWGVPEWDDRALFEKLILDGFQAGLSWITILRRRQAFRRAFDNFEPSLIANYNEAKRASLMADSGIIRNRSKIESTITNAQAYLSTQESDGFSNFLWQFVGGSPIINNFTAREQVPSETELSRTISKELKARGFRFVGPTIVYAFMQAVGMVNDHIVDCHRHSACQALSRS